MPDYTRTGVKICDNGYYGVMDSNLKVKSLPNYVEDILKYKSDCLQPSVKHDQRSVIVCSCISVSGVGEPVKTDETTNAKKHRQSLMHPAIFWKSSDGLHFSA